MATDCYGRAAPERSPGALLVSWYAGAAGGAVVAFLRAVHLVGALACPLAAVAARALWFALVRFRWCFWCAPTCPLRPRYGVLTAPAAGGPVRPERRNRPGFATVAPRSRARGNRRLLSGLHRLRSARRGFVVCWQRATETQSPSFAKPGAPRLQTHDGCPSERKPLRGSGKPLTGARPRRAWPNWRSVSVSTATCPDVISCRWRKWRRCELMRVSAC